MNTIAQHTDYSLMLGLFSHANGVVRREDFVEDASQSAT
jgi:hypothetical protein